MWGYVQYRPRVRWLALAVAATLTVTALTARSTAAQSCPGDCSGDLAVTINELITCVSIALGTSPPEPCPACDTSGDGTVMINELIESVSVALGLFTVTAEGTCLRPGPAGLESCADGTMVQVARCDDRGRCLNDPQATTALEAEGVDTNGAFSITIDGCEAVGAALLFEAEVEPETETTYRVIAFGPVAAGGGSNLLASFGRGSGVLQDIVIGPSSEAAVRLLDANGLENFDDQGIREIIVAVEVANADTVFAGLDAAEAADVATEVAKADPNVQEVIQTRRVTPTPTVTSVPNLSPTRTPTATNKSTPMSTLTPTNTPTGTTTPTHTPIGTPATTPTETPTNSQAATNTPTPTPAVASTATPTNTVTPMAPDTPTPTNTPTSIQSASPTRTHTPPRTHTHTPTSTSTVIPTNIFTPTNTPAVTPTSTRTATPTSTPTTTAFPTHTPTSTSTEIPPNTFTQTNTPTVTPTNTPISACNGATIIPSGGGFFAGTTTGSNTLAPDPMGNCGGLAETGPERVFQWTPTRSGTAVIETCGTGTNFDTVVYLRSGSCGFGAEVECNDDACDNELDQPRASRIMPSVIAGQTYFIIVDGFGGASGDFALSVLPPPTACDNATEIPSGGGLFAGTTTGANTLEPDPMGNCGGLVETGPERVFQWTPSVTGLWRIETCGGGTDFDTVVYLRSGNCEFGAEIDCDDDACVAPALASSITQSLTFGVTYFIIVDGFGGSSGDFSLSVLQVPS